MTNGEKRPGSPLEGRTSKSFIVGSVNRGAPSPRVAHPQKLAGVAGTSDSHRGAMSFGEDRAPAQQLPVSSGISRRIVRQPTWDLESFIKAGCFPAPTPTNQPTVPDSQDFNEPIRPPSTTSSLIRRENSTLDVAQTISGFNERGSSDIGMDGFPGAPGGEDCEAVYAGNEQDATSSPSSGLSYVTDDEPATHVVDVSPLTTPGEGLVFPYPERLPRLPEVAQDTSTGIPPLTSNENHEDPLVSGPPIIRRPAVVSITSGEHSRRQRSPPLRDSSALDAYDSSTSSTFTGLANQHGPLTITSTFDKGTSDPEAGSWTRGAFVIGRSAPVKIDKRIEVYLKSGANWEVDFVI